MDHLIRVRRDESLAQDQRWQLTVNALALRGFSYNFAAIVGLFWKSRTDYWRQPGSRSNFPKRSVICSQLYADAYMKTCSRLLGDPKNPAEQTPASLSAAKLLRDVPIGWLKVG